MRIIVCITLSFLLILSCRVRAQDLIIDGGIATNISSGINSFGNTVVGLGSDSNTLTVENPGTVVSNSVNVYSGAGVSKNSLIVTNGAFVTGTQIFVGGFGGSNNSLTIAGAGTVTGANMWVGYQTGPQNSATISGSGSTLNVTSGFNVGDGSSSNTVAVSAGGNLVTAGGTIVGLDSVGSSPGLSNGILVTGSGSQWSNTGGLILGQSGTGTLTIGSGGSVTSDTITIASSNGAVGSLNLGTPGGNSTNVTLNASSISFGSGTGSLVFNQSDTTTVSAVISSVSGNSTMNQVGSGTTILTANNLNFNGDVSVSHGALQVGTNGTNGPFGGLGKVKLTNNGTFIIDINNNYQYTMANQITGQGSLKSIGGGNLVLTGSNDYAGITIVQAVNCQCSGIQLGDGGTSGSLGTGTLILSATNFMGTNFYPNIRFDRSDTLTITNTIISGLGQINQNGSGTTVLAGTVNLFDTNFPTNGGSVFVNNGGLVISGTFNGGTNSYLDVGTTNVPVTMSFTSNSVTTLNSIIVGASTIDGTTNISGSNLVTVDHAKVTLAGVLAVGGADSPGGNVMIISNASTVTSTNLWVGADSDNNKLIVTGTNTHLTVIGTSVGIYIGDAGNSNSMTISNGASLHTIGQTYIGTYTVASGETNPGSNNFVLVTGTNTEWFSDGLVKVGDSGTGTLTVANGGKITNPVGIILAQSNGAVGTLNFGDFGKNDAGGSVMTPKISFGSGSGTINFNQSNTVSLTSSITGLGTVNQLGTGTTILSGNNTYTGTTTISAGTVETTTETALGNSMVNLNAGTLALMSKLTITSPLIWNSSALVAITMLGQNNYLNATGKVSLTGSGLHYFNLTGNMLGLTPEPLFFYGTNGFTAAQFGVVGLSKYSLFTSNNILYIVGLTNTTPSVVYPQTFGPEMPNYYLSLSTITFSIASSVNNDFIQRMSALRTSDNGDVINGLPENAPVIENDGKNYVPPQEDKNPVDAKNPVLAASPSSPMQAGFSSHWGMFIDLNGIYARANSGNMLPNYNIQSGGGIAGPIYHWNRNFTTGIYAGYEGTYINYGGGSNLKDNSVRFGVFGTYAQSGGKGYYVNALAGGGYNNYQVVRSINLPGINLTANSSPGAGELDAMLAGGYDFKSGRWTYGPLVSAQYAYLGANGVTESGAQNLNFTSSGWQSSSLIGSLGGHVNYLWEVSPNVSLIPQLYLSWQHEFLQDPYNINGSLGGNPAFASASATPVRDSLYTGVGFTVNFYKKLNTSFYYNTSLGNNNLVSQNIFWSLDMRF